MKLLKQHDLFSILNFIARVNKKMVGNIFVLIDLPEGSEVSLTSSTSANPTILGASSAGDLVLSDILEELQYL